MGWGDFLGDVAGDIVRGKMAMGGKKFLGKIYGKGAKIATTVGLNAVDKATAPARKTLYNRRKVLFEKIDDLSDKVTGVKTEGELLSDSFAGTKLLLCQKNDSGIFPIYVYSMGYTLKYTIGITPFSKAVRIKDSNKKEVARLKKKKFSFRFPLLGQSDPKDFKVWVDDYGTDVVRTHLKGLSRVCISPFHGWVVKGNFWDTNFKIVSDDRTIASVVETSERSEKHYVLSCVDSENILPALVLAVTSLITKE